MTPQTSASPSSKPLSSFVEIRSVLQHFSPPDLSRMTAILSRAAADSQHDPLMDHIAPVLSQVVSWRPDGGFHHPRICLFTADYPGENMAALSKHAARLKANADPLNHLCATIDSDLRLYELQIDKNPAALAEVDFAHAAAYGMMAVEAGVDILSVASLSPAANAWARSSLNGKNVSLDTLLTGAGRDIAAITGTLIAARLARIPVILEGPAAYFAACALERERVGSSAHCVLATPLRELEAGARPLLLPVVLPEAYDSPQMRAAPLAISRLNQVIDLFQGDFL